MPIVLINVGKPSFKNKKQAMEYVQKQIAMLKGRSILF
ncbi:hypothetical protein N824_02140 [Pedobacter sp. V48]|nr:hypothetical protein N824_02140 [Pedobacter sp. V48]